MMLRVCIYTFLTLREVVLFLWVHYDKHVLNGASKSYNGHLVIYFYLYPPYIRTLFTMHMNKEIYSYGLLYI